MSLRPSWEEVRREIRAIFYESADGVRAKASLHFPAHRARFEDFHARGTLLMIGPFANSKEGAMGVFTTREAAEELAEGDPFVLEGAVREWCVRGWNEALVG